MGARHSRQSDTTCLSPCKEMEDTVTLARQEREKQGPWEAEVSYGEEADLHQHLVGCAKNPGHLEFVPIDQFNVDHLPPGCQDKDIVDIVRAISNLTVRVSVKYVSKKRPKKCPRSGQPYPCYKDRGSNMMRVGTGWAWKVAKISDKKKNRYKTCPCQECRISPTPKTQFAHINIITAAHVVYNSFEAAHTTCHLFFDKGGTPNSCSGVVTLSGGSVKSRNIDVDLCLMTFVTHDLDLVYMLDKMVNHMYTLGKRWREKLFRMYYGKKKASPLSKDLPDACTTVGTRWNERLIVMDTGEQRSASSGEDAFDALNNLAIIVSHPHGCSKQVSIGDRVDRLETFNPCFPRKYTTATCPGSSGAPVWAVKGTWLLFSWPYCPVHTGSCEGNKNLNYCSDCFL